MKIVVLITGSLRDKSQFIQVVDGALALAELFPQVVDVRLASTDEKSTILSGTSQWSHRSDFHVICSDPPSIVVKGHRLHQLRQLDSGIEGLEPDTWVLKLRTDKLVLSVEQLTLCIRRVAAAEESHAGKFGILEGHLFLPWFINDMAFFAQVRSLREILAFDVAGDIIAPNLATEQVIWSRLLAEDTNDFFKSVCCFPQVNQLRSRRDGQSASDISQTFEPLRNILRRYWQVLHTRFFPITDSRFKNQYCLKVCGIELISDRIFTRYDDWGASFTDPSIFRELLYQVDMGNRSQVSRIIL